MKDKAKDQIINSSERILIVLGGLSVGTIYKIKENPSSSRC